MTLTGLLRPSARSRTITREMQGIVGQPLDFKLGGQLSLIFERLSQRSTELSCTRFEEERSRKDRENQRPSTSNVVVRFFYVNTSAHARV